MIISVLDQTTEVARGLSRLLRFNEGDLVDIRRSDLVVCSTTFGQLMGPSNEIKGNRGPMVSTVKCVIYVGMHPNGLCNVYHPSLGMVWVMPSSFDLARKVADCGST